MGLGLGGRELSVDQLIRHVRHRIDAADLAEVREALTVQYGIYLKILRQDGIQHLLLVLEQLQDDLVAVLVLKVELFLARLGFSLHADNLLLDLGLGSLALVVRLILFIFGLLHFDLGLVLLVFHLVSELDLLLDSVVLIEPLHVVASDRSDLLVVVI